MITFLLLSLLTESITELLLKSRILLPVRNIVLKSGSVLLIELISCGYCFSFWVSLFLILVASSMKLIVFPSVTYLFVMVLLVHRGSNILHMIIDKHFDKRYDIRYKV